MIYNAILMCEYPLFEGISDQGRVELIQDATLITCDKGHVLLKEGDGGTWIGLVKSGLVAIYIKGRRIRTMGPGESFGEIAYLLGGLRSATVIVAEAGTQAVLLNRSAITRLTSQRDQATFWQNVARCLAQRLVDRD
jgi:CRP-like cAMP-binding protein